MLSNLHMIFIILFKKCLILSVGHADVVMGFIATNNDSIHERLRFLQNGKYTIVN